MGVRAGMGKQGGMTPINVCLRQEIDRLRRIISAVRSTLNDLKLAIDGTIIMSEHLRNALDCLFDARVPAGWTNISWPSTTIGFWFSDLVQRNQQLSEWVHGGRPNVFWLTGFFNPQGFLTAMRQEITRAHKGWALDNVKLQTDVMKQMKEDITSAPAEGIYIHGLFLEGASWDRRNSKLIECQPKVLFTAMPVIHVSALNSIFVVDLKTSINPETWVLRGVALLADTA